MYVHKSIRHSCSFTSYYLSPFSWKPDHLKDCAFHLLKLTVARRLKRSRGGWVGREVGGIEVGISAGRKLHVSVRDRPRRPRHLLARGTALSIPQPPRLSPLPSRLPRSGAAGPARSTRGQFGAAAPSPQPNMEAPQEAAPGRGHSPAASRPTPAPRRCPGHTGDGGWAPESLTLPPSRSARRAPHGSRAGRREPEPVSLPPSPQAGQELPGGSSAAPGAGTGTHRVRGAVGSRGRHQVSGAVPGNRERERRSAGGGAGGSTVCPARPGAPRPALRSAPGRSCGHAHLLLPLLLLLLLPRPGGAAPGAGCRCLGSARLRPLRAVPPSPLPWRWPRVGAPEPSAGAPRWALPAAPLRSTAGSVPCRGRGCGRGSLLWWLGFGRFWSASHPDMGKHRGLRCRSSEWALARQGAALRCP